MATDPITVEADARRLLERAVAADTAPTLTTAEVDDLLLMAEDSATWPGTGLNGAAATGWRWKAGKVSEDFTVSLENGVKFAQEQVYQHCRDMERAYLSGTASVLGTPRRRGGIVSVPLVSEIGELP